MKLIAIIAGAIAGLNFANAQVQPKATVIGSSSGQFFVSARGGVSPQSLDLAAAPGMLTLDPALLAISCDRIKSELLRELNVPDQWQGKIFVIVRPARSANDSVTVVPERLGRTWHCRVQMPDAIDQNRLVEAVVRATLLEIANRNAKDQPAEIPEWLPRGLTRQLIGSSAMKIILRSPRKTENGLPVTREMVDLSDSPQPSGALTRKKNPLADALEVLRRNDALTFDQLSWPTDEQLYADGKEVYDSCSQLFVSQLLRLKTGPECLRAMLAEMPDYLNWQLAFEDAFQGTFKTPLEVEKWWALELADFNGRDLLHLLTPAESFKQLDVAFQIPIAVQIGQGAAMRTGITLQTVIRGWSRPRQLVLLKNKIWELGLLRRRVSPECMSLVDQYVRVLQDYYKKRGASTRNPGADSTSDKWIEETLAGLDALDVQRANLRQSSQAQVVSTAETTQAVAP